MRSTRRVVASRKSAKDKNTNGRYLVLAGLVIVLVIVVSYVTRGALNNEIPASPAEAVTDTIPAVEQAPAAPEPEPVTVLEGIM